MAETNCTGTTTYKEWQFAWSSVKVATVVLSVIPLSISLSLAVYMISKMRQPRKSSTDGNYAAAINALCVTAAMLTFMRIGVDLDLILGYDTDAKCTASMMAKNIFYISAMGTIYLILWLRQQVFYSNAALKYLRTVAVRILSWCSLFFVTGGSVAMSILYITTASYVSSACGCVKIDEVSDLKYAGGLCGSIVTQGTLLALLLYPLLRRQRFGAETKWKAADCVVTRRFVKRAFIATLICILSDSASSAMGMVLGKYEAYKVVYEINLVINLISIVCSFPDWRDRFLPCCRIDGIAKRLSNMPIIPLEFNPFDKAGMSSNNCQEAA